MRYLPKPRIKIPDIEILNTLDLGTLDPKDFRLINALRAFVRLALLFLAGLGPGFAHDAIRARKLTKVPGMAQVVILIPNASQLRAVFMRTHTEPITIASHGSPFCQRLHKPARGIGPPCVDPTAPRAASLKITCDGDRPRPALLSRYRYKCRYLA